METMTLVMTCPICGEMHSVTVRENDFRLYEEGVLAQVAFPNLNLWEREAIISHICPKCQDAIFGTEEEVDDDFEDYYDLEMGFDPYEGCYTFDC